MSFKIISFTLYFLAIFSAHAGEQLLFPGQSASIGDVQVSCLGRSTPKDFLSLNDLTLVTVSESKIARCYTYHYAQTVGSAGYRHFYILQRYVGAYDPNGNETGGDTDWKEITRVEMYRDQAKAASIIAPVLRDLIRSGGCDK